MHVSPPFSISEVSSKSSPYYTLNSWPNATLSGSVRLSNISSGDLECTLESRYGCVFDICGKTNVMLWSVINV